jgi:hypothetical protein
MKKDLSEKERKINNLLLLNENLRKEIKELKIQQRNKDQDEKLSNKTNENTNNILNTERKSEKIDSKNIIHNQNKAENELNFNFNEENSIERLTKNSIFSYENNYENNHNYADGNEIPMNNKYYNVNKNNINNKNSDLIEKEKVCNLNDQKKNNFTNPFYNNNLIYDKTNNNLNNDYNNQMLSNSYNIKEILKENEYLKDKYHKYEKKYIKHKSIKKQYKKLLKNFKQDSEKEKRKLI